MRTEWENDGAPRLFGQAAESYLLLEYAPHSRLEMGADLYSAGAANDLLFNAKWLLLAEKGRRPAVAAGFLELGSGYTATNYLVATKAVGQGLRMHFGFAAAGSGQTALFGAEQQVGEKDYLLLDYASWAAGYTSLGVYHDLSPGVGVNLAYAWPNADGESGLVLLNLSCTQARR